MPTLPRRLARPNEPLLCLFVTGAADVVLQRFFVAVAGVCVGGSSTAVVRSYRCGGTVVPPQWNFFSSVDEMKIVCGRNFFRLRCVFCGGEWRWERVFFSFFYIYNTLQHGILRKNA